MIACALCLPGKLCGGFVCRVALLRVCLKYFPDKAYILQLVKVFVCVLVCVLVCVSACVRICASYVCCAVYV